MESSLNLRGRAVSEMFRLRITFSKDGRLRWLSHLEVMRAMERLVRRSGLPYAVTQGFNKHMRTAIGPALPVGTAGLNEIFDVWLVEYVAVDQAAQMLTQAAGDALGVKAVEYVLTTAKGLQATHVINHYLLVVDTGGLNTAELQFSLDSICAMPKFEVTQKKKTKTLDLASIIIEPLQVLSVATDGGCVLLSCTLRTLSTGSLRPEQLVMAALDGRGDIVSVTRTSLAEEA